MPRSENREYCSVNSMREIAPGLRRWTALHEEWEEQVASLALDTADGLVLIDPIDPPRGLRKPEHVLLTVFWHGRSAGGLRAKHVWAWSRSVRRLRNRGVEVTDPFEPGDELPGGVRAFETARDGEVVFWLPAQRAVAVGDVVLGAGAKPRATSEPLRLCPERWLGGASHDDLRTSLRPLLDLPVQRVLVSHGEPVVRAGKRALAAVLAG
jgi:glyoxylase-like metal-dependent hydrolase (beta-lactamase superfamily II)